MDHDFTASRQVPRRIGATLAAAAAFLIAAGAGAQEADPPNILLILADDLGYSDIGAFGGEIRTPNLDALASAGMKLTNFHAGPVCNVTRLQLIAGMDSNIATDPDGASAATRTALRHDALTIAEALAPAGYRSYMVGKWDLGQREDQSPIARGFERAFALLPGTASHFDEKPLARREPVYFDGTGKPVELDPDFYSTRAYTDSLLDFLKADEGDERPFFAFLSYTAPHFPVQAPDEYIDRYDGVYGAGYDEVRANRLRRMRIAGILPAGFADAPLPPETTPWDKWPSDEERRLDARRMQAYAGMIDYMDEEIGRILSYLEASGALEDTLILFTSDNGATARWAPPVFVEHAGGRPDNSFGNLGRRGSWMTPGAGWSWVSNAPFNRYKMTPHEGGHAVPAIAFLPGAIPAGAQSDVFLSVRDLLPTFVDFAGAEIPRRTPSGAPAVPVEGVSARAALGGDPAADPNRGRALGFEGGGAAYLFKDGWKILRRGEAWALYDMATDRAEQHDLAAARPEKLKELTDAWAANAERVSRLSKP